MFQVSVNVIDMNDNRPRFSLPMYETEVAENIRPGTTIFSLAASDRDTDNTLQFSLVNTEHVLSQDMFRVGPVNGDVVLTQPLDRWVVVWHVGGAD